MGEVAAARQAFEQGLKECPRSGALLTEAALFEAKLGAVARARALFDRG